MAGPTTSTAWVTHPGDYLLVETHGEFLRPVRRSTNDIEAQRELEELEKSGRKILVLRVVGAICD